MSEVEPSPAKKRKVILEDDEMDNSMNQNQNQKNQNQNQNGSLNDKEGEEIIADKEVEEMLDEVAPSGKKPKYEEIKKDQTLLEFLENMDTYTPVIPDAVTNYYLQRSGFDCEDIRVKRLIALAAQKFVADIAHDALQYSKSRNNSTAAGLKEKKKDRKLVLTMEDLSSALVEHGINAGKPEYYT